MTVIDNGDDDDNCSAGRSLCEFSRSPSPNDDDDRPGEGFGSAGTRSTRVPRVEANSVESNTNS
ncbi:hypothetical protein SCLCIDRAFT_1219803 [Scleroderma citrinum Foug A]|uniref:Uncharacterized protein n=1 Tax=Scleroderma citrinum Foug A TaxID=1036808 RepID=A0A0C3DL07_9AGAM|nr:hypothetical protein SCLCIDRAFT_1219803 [Scleroderma citrinum Foug A]